MAIPEFLQDKLKKSTNADRPEPHLREDDAPSSEPDLSVSAAGGGREQQRRERMFAAQKGLKPGDTVWLKAEVLRTYNFEEDREPSSRFLQVKLCGDGQMVQTNFTNVVEVKMESEKQDKREKPRDDKAERPAENKAEKPANSKKR